ncbi:hypothetical protein PTI98_007146 [Pleurotus ostreatus]|nr:hypothetical protein PTI98_007146 [Pleurotus ostreatus]
MTAPALANGPSCDREKHKEESEVDEKWEKAKERLLKGLQCELCQGTFSKPYSRFHTVVSERLENDLNFLYVHYAKDSTGMIGKLNNTSGDYNWLKAHLLYEDAEILFKQHCPNCRLTITSLPVAAWQLEAIAQHSGLAMVTGEPNNRVESLTKLHNFFDF